MLIGGLVLICYWPALNGALLWDDPAHVTRPDLRSWAGLIRIWTSLGATQQYYPVLHSAFWLEHRLWGEATLGYHLVNVVLHAASCCLLAVALRRLWSWTDGLTSADKRRERTIPAGTEWLVALIFAVHPVCTESVAWISEQKNTLSLFLYLVAGLAYLRFAERRHRWTYWVASALFLLAIGTKTVTATLPAALLVVLWWKQGRLGWRRDVFPLLPWFGAGLVAGLFTAWVERNLIGAQGAAFDLSLVERVLLAGRVIWFYAAKLVWPVDLAFFYPRWDVSASAVGWIGYLAAALAVTIGLWLLRRRTPGLLAGWLLYGGSLFPALGFFNVYPFAFSYVADHFQYLASVSFIATVVGGSALALAPAPRWVRRGALLAVGAVVVLFGIRTTRESRLYINDETLFRTTLERSPGSWIAHQILAVTYAKTPGREAEAIAHYEAVIRLNPGHPEAYHGLGVEMAKQPGRRPDAIELYRRAVDLRPEFVEARNNLGVELTSNPATLPEAIAHLEAVLQLKPQHAGAHVNLAHALSQVPARRTEAIEHYETALRLQPDDVRAFVGLAHLLAQIPGRLTEAVARGEAAVRAHPDNPEAHYHLGNALAETPARLPDAIAHYRAALRLDEDLPLAHYGLANALARSPLTRFEAIAHYEMALSRQPRFVEAHVNLGNVLGSIPERRAEAVAHYETALQLNPNLAYVHLNLALLLAEMPERRADAFRHCEEALRLQPDYLDALNSLAILHAQQGGLEEARSLWERALQVNPAFEAARRNLELLERTPAP